MFKSQRFTKQLERTIASEVRTHRLSGYDPEIVSYLQGLAVHNQRAFEAADLEKTERKTVRSGSAAKKAPAKSAGLQKSPAKREAKYLYEYSRAADSTRALIGEAMNYVEESGEPFLKVQDVQLAYGRRFCTIYPFCR